MRASGYTALHDEDEAFRRGTEEARSAAGTRRAGLDWYSFVVAFKGVLLEGLEVVVIVITFGSTQRQLPIAAAAARDCARARGDGRRSPSRAPLSRVPENSLKFTVGLLLTTFGIFWGAEGTGVKWPGGDVSILGVLGFVALSSFTLVRVLRQQRAAALLA